MTCQLCCDRGKTWQGSDPACGFEKYVFSTSNWNCATLNTIRDLIEEHGHSEWIDDCGIGVLSFAGNNFSGHLVLTWYKRRGRVGMAVFMCDEQYPIPLTLQMAEEAIEYYAKKEQK